MYNFHKNRYKKKTFVFCFTEAHNSPSTNCIPHDYAYSSIIIIKYQTMKEMQFLEKQNYVINSLNSTAEFLSHYNCSAQMQHTHAKYNGSIPIDIPFNLFSPKTP